MICNNCKIDKPISDFINTENICYKCMYRIKIAKSMKKRIEKPILCRQCGNPVIVKDRQKKRQRTIFCSQECAQKGHKKQLNNHWTRKIGQTPEILSGQSIKNRPISSNSRSHI